MHRRLRALASAFFAAFAAAACAERTPVGEAPEPVVLDAARAPFWVATHAALAVDVDPSLDVAAVRDRRVVFRRYDDPRPTFRGGAGTIWMQLVVRVSPGSVGVPWVLVFSHPRPRGVELHWNGEDGAPHVARGGMRLAAAAHDVPARSVVLRLPLPASGERTFFVRADAYPVGFSATVQPESLLHEEEALSGAVLGLYYGAALALVAFHLVLFVLLRRRAYLLYAAVVATHALFFLARNGWLWRLGLWSATSRNMGGLLVSLHVLALVLFTADVLRTRETAPLLHRLVRWAAAAAAANLALAAAGLGVVADPLGLYVGLAATALVMVIGVRQCLQGETASIPYLAGFSAFLAGSLLYGAKTAGWIPHTPFTEHAMQLGSAVDLVFAALALAAHVRELEVRQRAAENRLQVVSAEREREVARVRAEGLAAALRAQDEERRRIARDLHDDLGHLLLRVGTGIRALPARPPELDGLVTESLETVRAISRDLYPSALETLGLSRALQAAAEQTVRPAGVELALAVDDIDALVARDAQADVYRTVQEALRNALTHARPGTVSVEAYREGGEVFVAVADDGAGFDAARVAPGSGLRNMRQRAQLAGGALSVDSAPGEGTRVELRLPVRSDERPAA